jgi:hypothetical protein
MAIEAAALLKIISPVVSSVTPHLVKKIHSKINPTELQKALEIGIKAAVEQEKAIASSEQLFFKSQLDGIGGVANFLQEFFVYLHFFK